MTQNNSIFHTITDASAMALKTKEIHEKEKTSNIINETNDNKSIDHKERTKSRDLEKKMGGGKKGLWNNKRDLAPPIALDSKDPNYDSEDGDNDNIILVSNSKDKINVLNDNYIIVPDDIKKEINNFLIEFFTSGVIEEVIHSIEKMDAKPYHFEIVKRGIILAMEKYEKDREMFSQLISELYPDYLSMQEIEEGFKRLLLTADDIEIDIPSAKTMLATFLARAIVDEIIPPKFLEDEMYDKDVNPSAYYITSLAIKKLSINHGIARMEKGWGPGDGRPVDELKIEIDQIMNEYLLSKDLIEAARCVKELNVPLFHHEVIKRGIVNALEKTCKNNNESIHSMSNLLAYLFKQEIVSSAQFLKGFDKVKLCLDDLTLDVPNAKEIIKEFVKQAIQDKILPSTYTI